MIGYHEFKGSIISRDPEGLKHCRKFEDSVRIPLCKIGSNPGRYSDGFTQDSPFIQIKLILYSNCLSFPNLILVSFVQRLSQFGRRRGSVPSGLVPFQTELHQVFSGWKKSIFDPSRIREGLSIFSKSFGLGCLRKLI